MAQQRIRLTNFHDDPDYKDGGCFLHPSCLTCPEPVCIFDLPSGRASFRAIQRRNQIQILHAASLTPAEMAARLGVSLRTVYSDLAVVGLDALQRA